MEHRCWSIDEIVRAIATILVADRAKASAVALASCSKSLEQPTLAEVWRSLRSLSPLVQCFPPEIWKVVKEKLHFRRAPLQAEWCRFQERYASKVRYLDLSYHSSGISLNALHLLQHYSPGSTLLPRLVSLVWTDNDLYFPFLAPFISPSLTSIFIPCMNEADLMLPLIFNKLSTLPHINEVMIDRWRDQHDPSIQEASSQLLMQCNQHLRRYMVFSPISAAALRHAIQLPSLEEFWLIASFQLPDPLPTVVFPNLRSLEVECNGDPAWLKLLSAIQNPVLTKMKITCPESAIERCMEDFQRVTTGCGMHKSFRELWIGCGDEIDVQVTSRMVACSISFKNLTTLVLFSELDCIDLCNTADLTDDDIDLLTNAMPCLEYLAVGSCNPCSIPSQITFKSLYTISHRCTQLTDLMIHFNPALFVAKVGANESWDVALGLSDPKTLPSDLCSVRVLRAGEIPLPTQSNAPLIMALGLARVFPCLETIEHGNDDWKKVVDLMWD